MFVYRSVFCIRKKLVEGLKKKTNTEHALDYWQVVTTHILKYLEMLPCKTCCSSAHQKQFDFMGITSARKCSIQFVQLCLKSKKHLVARILFQENFRHSQDRNTHRLCFFWSPVISGNTIKCHLYPPNVRLSPRPNRSI